MNTMFDTLLQLPLFQGLSHEDLSNILGKVRLHFDKHKSGEEILQSGTPCDRLMFVLKGIVIVSTCPTDASYTLTEHLLAPYLIEPYSLFGMRTAYASTYTAYGEVHTVSVSKSFIMTELFKYEIFRLNYLNIISNRAQNLSNRLWNKPPCNLRSHLCRFILTHIDRPAGWKSLKINIKQLAQIVNETRNGVSKELNLMQQEGIVELHRGEIVIPDAAKLEVFSECEESVFNFP